MLNYGMAICLFLFMAHYYHIIDMQNRVAFKSTKKIHVDIRTYKPKLLKNST